MMEASRIILFVKDMKSMLDFYQNTLGLPLVESAGNSDGFVSLHAGAIQLSLHKIPAGVARKIEITDPPAERTSVPLKLVFGVQDIAAERKALIAKGVSMHKTQNFGAISFCDGVDPEGNIFQISNRA